jgi:type II secretory pathway pseudopilin PulG
MKRKNKKAFTLVELLLAVIFVVILATIMISEYGASTGNDGVWLTLVNPRYARAQAAQDTAQATARLAAAQEESNRLKAEELRVIEQGSKAAIEANKRGDLPQK